MSSKSLPIFRVGLIINNSQFITITYQSKHFNPHTQNHENNTFTIIAYLYNYA